MIAKKKCIVDTHSSLRIAYRGPRYACRYNASYNFNRESRAR